MGGGNVVPGRPPSRAGSLPQGEYISKVGAGLLAKNDNTVNLTECLALWVDDIQSPIHSKVRQHDDLGNGQRRTALGAGQVGGEITGQDVG